jgi:hypothetical protein
VTEHEPVRLNSNEMISRHAYFFVAVWVTIILLFYSIVGIIGSNKMRKYKAETQELRHAWISTMELDSVMPVSAPSATATQVAVNVLVNSVGNFSLREGRWDTDFDISFRWRGDAVDPGATFQIVNGEILRREKEVSHVVDGERFERYNVRARMEQAFDPARFPFSDAGLVVQIQDESHDTSALRYKVYRSGVRLDPLAVSHELKITRTYAGVKLYSYGQESASSTGNAEVHSRFVFAMFVEPRGIEIYMKMFQALFASVAIALVVFFIKPTFVDPRFGLGVGAFFAAIGNNIFLVTLLPPADRVTLTDMVNLVGLVTIFLTLVQSTISLHFCDTERYRLSRTFDRLCFPLFVIGYVTVNFLLPWVAKG